MRQSIALARFPEQGWPHLLACANCLTSPSLSVSFWRAGKRDLGAICIELARLEHWSRMSSLSCASLPSGVALQGSASAGRGI